MNRPAARAAPVPGPMPDAAWAACLRYARHGAECFPDLGTLTPAFRPLADAQRADRPLIVAQCGQSLDGRIATETGESTYINGVDGLTHLHRIRALVDAVLVGAGTARADNPKLTVRHCAGPSPARIVIDPRGTIAPDAAVWADDGTRRLVIGGHPNLPREIERLGAPDTITAAWVRRRLADQGLTRVLVEGGPITLGKFLAEGLVDHLHVLIGPMIIGSGPTGLCLPPIARLDQALRPVITPHIFPSGDVLLACTLAD